MNTAVLIAKHHYFASLEVLLKTFNVVRLFGGWRKWFVANSETPGSTAIIPALIGPHFPKSTNTTIDVPYPLLFFVTR